MTTTGTLTRKQLRPLVQVLDDGWIRIDTARLPPLVPIEVARLAQILVEVSQRGPTTSRGPGA